MPKSKPSAAVRFTDEALREITETLRKNARPERLELLPEILIAWSTGALPDYLSRNDRQAYRARAERLADVSDAASDLLQTLQKLDDTAWFEITCRAFLFARGFSEPRWGLVIADGAPEIITAAECQRDEALSWLKNLIKALGAAEPEPHPPRRTRSYLVVLDLAAFFEFVTGKRPTLSNTHYKGTTQLRSGLFWNFLCCVGRSVPEVKSFHRAAQDVLKHYHPGAEDSEWFANTYTGLWTKMRLGSH